MASGHRRPCDSPEGNLLPPQGATVRLLILLNQRQHFFNDDVLRYAFLLAPVTYSSYSPLLAYIPTSKRLPCCPLLQSLRFPACGSASHLHLLIAVPFLR